MLNNCSCYIEEEWAYLVQNIATTYNLILTGNSKYWLRERKIQVAYTVYVFSLLITFFWTSLGHALKLSHINQPRLKMRCRNII